jgi:hypothetical protein
MRRRGSPPRTAPRPGSACCSRWLLTGGAAVVIGAITLRLGGHYLPLSTIAWGLSIALLFGNVAALGSHTGLSNVPPVRIGPWSLADPRSMYYLVWVLVGLACLFSHNLLHSRHRARDARPARRQHRCCRASARTRTACGSRCS